MSEFSMTQDTTAYVKTYVNVVVEHRSDGKKTPREIRFDDGRRFEFVDGARVRRRSVSL